MCGMAFSLVPCLLVMLCLKFLTELTITQCPPRNPDFLEPDSRQWLDENDVHCNLMESGTTRVCVAGPVPGEGNIQVRCFTPHSLGGPVVLMWNRTTLDLYKGEPFSGIYSPILAHTPTRLLHSTPSWMIPVLRTKTARSLCVLLSI